jgi:hypothetical protein
MAQAEVIREFLVKLGFSSDEKSLKKFTDGVEGATKNVAKLVATIAGAALTVGAGVAAFAANMEALYFSAKKMGASAVNAKAFEKAMANFGVASGEALQSVQSLARWMRSTPASEGFLRSLGVETRDTNGKLKDTVDLMSDLGVALRSKPYYLAQQYAQIFGISEDVLRAMLDGKFDAEMEKQRKALKDSGFDEAADKANKFMTRLRDLQTQIEAVAVSLGGPLLDVLGQIGKGWEEIYNWTNAGIQKMLEYRTEEQKNRGGENVAKLFAWFGNKEAQEALDQNAKRDLEASQSSRTSSGKIGGIGSSGTPQERLANLEKRYGLPTGLLDRIWAAESGRGKNMRSPAGAMGHFQFMPGTAKQYGLDNPDDFDQSSDAAARYYRDLMGKYGGNLEKAVAAYNWGPGNLDKNGLGKAPAETRGYLDKVLGKDRGSAGVTIAQNTTINVNGSDAAATGRAVAGEQNQVNQNQIRNLKTALN